MAKLKSRFSRRLIQRVFEVEASTRDEDPDQQRLTLIIRFDSPDSLRAYQTANPDQVKKVLRSINSLVIEISKGEVVVLAEEDRDDIVALDNDFEVRALLHEAHAILGTPVPRDAAPIGAGIRVAVVDTGIDGDHPSMAGAVVARANFAPGDHADGSGHGTVVASLLAGRAASGETPGFAPGAELLDARVLGADGRGSASSTVEGIEWAVEQRADIINLSLGAPAFEGFEDPIAAAARWAVAEGVIVVAAAGNCGPEGSLGQCLTLGDRTITTPGISPSVITVGATDKDKTIAGYSSRGPTPAEDPKPDLVTVGSDLVAARADGTSLGTVVDDGHVSTSGTSMAAPICSAIAAVALDGRRQMGRDLDPQAMRSLLLSCVEPLANVPATQGGAGFLSLAAVAERIGTDGPPVDETTAKALQIAFVHDGGNHYHVILSVPAERPGVRDVVARIQSVEARIEPDVALVTSIGPGESVTQDVRVQVPPSGVWSVVVDASYMIGSVAQHVAYTASVEGPAPPGAGAGEIGSFVREVRRALLARATHEEGLWHGRINFNVWTGAMYAILHKLVAREGEPTAVLDWLEDHRTGLDANGHPDGTWGIIDPPSIHMMEATVCAQVALEIWGRNPDDRAWQWLRSFGASRLADALAGADPFTQLFTALGSKYKPANREDYYRVEDILAPPIELIAVPGVLKASLPKLFAAWGQDGIYALVTIVTLELNKKPSILERVLLNKAERTLRRRQNEDGSWYDTSLPSFAATLAMNYLGYENSHPVMERAFAFLDGLNRPDGYVVRFKLPVWDTGLAILALREAGVPANNAALQKASNYLIESFNYYGGVPFQRENVLYPDTDDTAVAIQALELVQMGEREPEKREAIEAGLRWLLFMQGKDGGWAAFSRDQSTKAKGKTPFFKDDPPTADVTAHVLSALKYARGTRFEAQAEQAMKDGFAWLRRYQLEDGALYGRWGCTYTYGTGAVLQAVGDTAYPANSPLAQKAAAYLLRSQNADGGWGESLASYYHRIVPDPAPSTIEQTCWALMGLLSLPLNTATSDAATRGVAYLRSKWSEESAWGDGSHTVGALWVYNNTLYPLMWGLWATARFWRATGTEPTLLGSR